MFCGCSTTFGARAQHPGLPDLPGPARVAAGRERDRRRVGDPLGLALNCSIAEVVPLRAEELLLPGHAEELQTSQYDEPIAFDGWLDVDVETDEGSRRSRVEIERAHMEEGPARPPTRAATGASTAPTTRSSTTTARASHHRDRHQADRGNRQVRPRGRARLRHRALRELLRGLGVSDVKMEQGSLRCDANVSLRPAESPLGTRTETKNVNSLRSVERAIRYEMTRQAAVLLQSGGRSSRRPATGTRTPASPRAAQEGRRRTTATSGARPRPIAPSREWSRSCGPRCPRTPAGTPCPPAGGVGHLRFSTCRPSPTRAPSTRGADSGRRRRPGRRAQVVARRGWPAWPTSGAPKLPTCRSHRPTSPGSRPWSPRARSTQWLARQVIEACWPARAPGRGRGGPRPGRGEDDGPLLAAIDEALAAQPTSRRRSAAAGAAAGAIVGAVMKATRQADAARVRELLLERLGVSG